uniref:5-formyltetrahydrofolate cyclo-ligase n=1 Tax=Roseihalotalea indica TaxID=2867963 RepID=A0AA49GUJ9_9BACT|nr:5-formyltetrahydrofolate cyclo-ligase [Tunicatimonas sp. TK19036]
MTKAVLRRLYQSRRQALSEAEYAERNEQIFNQFRSRFPVYENIAKPLTIHCFLSSLAKREVDTNPLIQYFLSQPSITLAVPYTHISEERLSHHHYTEGMVLETNRWGIPEPHASTLTIDVAQIDWVLIPLLAFDKRGHRVGYGKGFYDRFLAECRPDTLKIGLSLDEPVERIDDINAYDFSLNYAVTPSRVWDFS